MIQTDDKELNEDNPEVATRVALKYFVKFTGKHLRLRLVTLLKKRL